MHGDETKLLIVDAGKPMAALQLAAGFAHLAEQVRVFKLDLFEQIVGHTNVVAQAVHQRLHMQRQVSEQRLLVDGAEGRVFGDMIDEFISQLAHVIGDLVRVELSEVDARGSEVLVQVVDLDTRQCGTEVGVEVADDLLADLRDLLMVLHQRFVSVALLAFVDQCPDAAETFDENVQVGEQVHAVRVRNLCVGEVLDEVKLVRDECHVTLLHRMVSVHELTVGDVIIGDQQAGHRTTDTDSCP